MKKLYEWQRLVKIKLNTKAGFSLLQVTITLGLIVITIMLSLPHFSFLQKTMVRSEIEKMYSLFVYMQHLAIATQKNQTIEFDVVKNTYFCNQQAIPLAQGIAFGTIAGVYGPPASPNALVNKPITFPNNKITFYAQGTMQAGTVYLVDRSKNYLYALTTPVSHISYVRRYKYEREWVPLT